MVSVYEDSLCKVYRENAFSLLQLLVPLVIGICVDEPLGSVRSEFADFHC